MAYLHENIEIFTTAVHLASEHFHIHPAITEKDYYLTMILRRLSEQLDFVVFKGGTSLSKCYKAIKRFSEDIDITIDAKLSQTKMKKLKDTIKSIAKELSLKIPNIDETKSRRSYNCYILEYTSIISEPHNTVQNTVLMETSFSEVSFPIELLPVHSYIGDMMIDEAPEKIKHFQLDPFEMKVQSIERTLVDKIFAICDYYIKSQVKKHSRHIYDIYKLLQFVPLTEDYKKLVKEVRKVRAITNICPSSQQGVNVPEILNLLIENEIYRDDYEENTKYILEEKISYETAIQAVKTIAESGMFEE